MRVRFLGAAYGLIMAGAFMLPMSFLLNQELKTSVGRQGEPTGEVFVSEQSEAAERGFAFPGEGTPANLIPGQVTRSEKFRAAGIWEIVLGFGLFAVVLVPGHPRRGRGAVLADAFAAVVMGLGALIVGSFVAFLTFAPLKVAPQGVFDSIFYVAFAGSLVFAVACAAMRLGEP